MKKPTKAETRRQNLLDNYWFKLYGVPGSPKRYARNTWAHLGMPLK